MRCAFDQKEEDSVLSKSDESRSYLPVPAKDQMGMDYIPVYAVPAGRQEEEKEAESTGIQISP